MPVKIQGETEEYKPRRILLQVEASAVHCSGDCVGLSNDGEECRLFHKTLRWDRSKQTNGQFRLEECRNAEALALAKNARPERGEKCTAIECRLAPSYIIRWESVGAQCPVYTYCCIDHLPVALHDYKGDVAGDGFKLECLS